MKKVAKVMIADAKGSLLMLLRSEHPTFPNDPDLPGGTIEPGEEPAAALVREVLEEVGIIIEEKDVTLLYRGQEFSDHGTEYSLYACQLQSRPNVTISWEHDSYRWLDRAEFMRQAEAAKDTYMHMVYEVMEKGLSSSR